ncbi:COQ9 family protein [Palleronia sediminis]|uniref:COQ9 family protein n=1 Tax=Palleronia sediminis TaxID=2547833 RepID=A0A4R6A2S2_9RHOB|nr:COQ9 family protein [Palleronia sediminis]TDL76258.1 COQ9 family protein [Palleronia sediminis]
MTDTKDRLLASALTHVPFDGWSEATLKAAARDAGVPLEEARAIFPRGAVDMALAFHRAGDAEMRARLLETDLSDMRFRDKVARAMRLRIESIESKEAVRRGATLFALPRHTSDGARAVWETSDTIWTALGDKSTDASWYTKRATLAGVWGSVLLFWLGDDSPGSQETWGFIDRRIDDVMRIEKVKAGIAGNRAGRAMMAGPNWILSRIRAPMRPPKEFPGSWDGGA